MNYNTEKPRCHLYFVLVYEHKVKTLSGSLDNHRATILCCDQIILQPICSTIYIPYSWIYNVWWIARKRADWRLLA